MYKIHYKTFSGDIENVKLKAKSTESAKELAYNNIDDCSEIINVELVK